jgi:[protein-PII] uridylyltransferase
MKSLDGAEAARAQRAASAANGATQEAAATPAAGPDAASPGDGALVVSDSPHDITRDLSALRAERTAQADAWLRDLLGGADGVALVAVGGYGRSELGPGSDLDVMMLHDGRSDVVQIADQVWYPIWDAGWQLDHSVRTVADAVSVANSDMKAALGMLHARHIAGVPDLTARLREHAFGQWRSRASKRLPELHEMVRDRAERLGEVAFLLEPDLKEARGGLRDVHALEAIAAAWVAAGPGPAVRAAYRRLIDVRDTLQEVAGRPTTRMVAQEQEAIAARLGMADADELLRAISEAARTVSYASDVTWRSVEGSLRRRPKAERKPVAEGVVEQDGEVVLARGVDPTPDPTLVVRAAAAAAQVGLPLSPPTIDLLATKCPPMPVPWPAAARDAFVALLGAGRPALVVFEALDQAGLMARLIPEWESVRYRRQHNPLHRYTVDRHLVEAAIEAAALTRRVARPDLLLLGALFHDIGKGSDGDHSIAGAALMPGIAARLGLGERDSAVLVTLVRYHLLLSQTATRRDLDDPATVAAVAKAVGSPLVLELLHALTEADARATGTAMWDDWRAGLVADLVRRTQLVLAGETVPLPGAPGADLPTAIVKLAELGQLAVISESTSEHSRITVVAPDQPGLLWRSAGVLALHRLGVRAATATSIGPTAVTVFDVEPTYFSEVDPARIQDDMRRAIEGGLDVAQKLARREATAATRKSIALPPATVLLPGGASDLATVLEVRAHDRPGLLFTVTRVLAAEGLDVRSARVETLGAEVVDAFYVTDRAGRPLSSERAETVRHGVEEALRGGGPRL